ncbi:siderophore-interacting protein [Microbacterium oxydans]|uniref:siderophore-interacting protein n=1 Tax=Microbacterium TaxID=33882 RepID=UPI00187D126D|nr:siderophore-interacting protein [Microbacterium sp. R1]MBE7955814.1 siderophore-interacting protein [Microbacterium sp. R1]
MSAETTTTERPTYILTRAEVRAVARVSPSFVRVTFGGDELSEFGTPGEVFDSRIKLVFPPASGALPDLDRASDNWWQAFLAVPEEERGSMRTYSVRELRVDDETGTEVDVDFVLHLEPGLTGPASLWASQAAVGQELYLVGPRRGVDVDAHGGAEFAPGTAASVVLAGDETAAPAIARILEDAPRDLRGVAFIEVPSPADILRIDVPSGVEVHWLPRDAGEPHGLRLIPAVLGHLGDADAADEIRVKDIDGEDLLWETPEYSGLGEDIATADAPAERYFWIAGESGVVTTLRRHLVKDLGIDRSQVAFMGYWRRGVAMRG